ncbi:Golgi reassembly-stacking protein 2-like [Festucalex cinctus]
MGVFTSVQIPKNIIAPGESVGYHVLKVKKNSPADRAGLEPFFDFILAICDTRLSQDNNTFDNLVKNNVGKATKLVLYSSKTQDVRETEIVPSNTWGGAGLLGITIRFSSFEKVRSNVWHVLEVQPDSPAAEAGLKPYTDYIIGADTRLYMSKSLFEILHIYEKKTLKLYVYNTDAVECREVSVNPKLRWGGRGSLGCGIGYGYLHRVPTKPSDNSEPSPPPDDEEAGLTAVVPTAPVCLSAGSEETDTSIDLISVTTDVPPPIQSVAVSASTQSSSEPLPTPFADAAVEQNNALTTTVVQIHSSPSKTSSSVINFDSVTITMPSGSSLYPVLAVEKK